MAERLTIFASPVDTFVRPADSTDYVEPVRPGDLVREVMPGNPVTSVRPGKVLVEGRTPDPVRPGPLPPLPDVSERSHLGEALSKFSETLARFQTNRRRDQEADDRKAGVRDYMKHRPKTQAERDKLLEGKSESYAEGVSIASARYDAMNAAAAVRADIESRPGDYQTQAQVDARIAQAIQSRLAGVTDKHYVSSFLNEFDKGEQTVRNVFEKRRRDALAQKNQENLFGTIAEDMESFAKMGDLEPSQVTAQLDQYYNLGRDLGLSRQQINELAVQATANAAIRYGRPELLDAFDQTKPDGTPGLAKSKAWGETLRIARSKAENARDQTVSEDLGVRKFQVRTTANDLLAQGTLTRSWLEERVREGTMTPATAASYDVKRMDREVAGENEAAIFNLFASGNGGRLYDVPGMSHKDVGDYFQRYARKRLQEAGDDPVARQRAEMEILLQGMDVGHMYEGWANDLKYSSPGVGTRFQAAARRYQWLQTQPGAKNLLQQTLTNDRAALFDSYHAALQATGDVEYALEVARSASDPKARAEASTRITRNYRQVLVTIEDELGLDGVSNQLFIRERVKELAGIRLAHKNTNLDEAVEWAIERVKATSYELQTPSGAKHLVWTGGAPLPAQYDKAVARFSREYQSKLQGTDNFDPEGYYVAPNPTNPTSREWLIYRITDGTPTGDRLNIDAMMGDYRKYRAKVEATETVTEHTNKQLDRLWNSMSRRERRQLDHNAWKQQKLGLSPQASSGTTTPAETQVPPTDAPTTEQEYFDRRRQ